MDPAAVVEGAAGRRSRPGPLLCLRKGAQESRPLRGSSDSTAPCTEEPTIVPSFYAIQRLLPPGLTMSWAGGVFNSSTCTWNSFDTSKLGRSQCGPQVPLWVLAVPHLHGQSQASVLCCETFLWLGVFSPTLFRSFFNEGILCAMLLKP